MCNAVKQNSLIFVSMSTFIFWQKWLFYSSLLFALSAIIFAIGGDSVFFEPYNQALNKVFWHSAEMPNEIKPFRRFIGGPLGGTIASSYILLAYIAYYPFKRKEKWARNAIIVAFGTWVILDSTLCFIYHMYFQIYIINAFSIIIKALPLFFTWKEFTLAKPTVRNL